MYQAGDGMEMLYSIKDVISIFYVLRSRRVSGGGLGGRQVTEDATHLRGYSDNWWAQVMKYNILGGTTLGHHRKNMHTLLIIVIVYGTCTLSPFGNKASRSRTREGDSSTYNICHMRGKPAF